MTRPYLVGYLAGLKKHSGQPPIGFSAEQKESWLRGYKNGRGRDNREEKRGVR